jgi:flagellar hook-associated protein 2
VTVTRLANSSQRSFTFTSPASEQTLTIEGQEFKLKAGESAKELASSINTDSKAPVYAAVLENGTLVLSSRATGNTGAEFIKVSGAALTEQAGTAKEGKDAEFEVDGVAGTSSSNTVTGAIPGVTLTLGGLTPNGPVTIDVEPPGPNASVVEAQVQSFVKLYNSTVEAIQTQLQTKPPTKYTSTSEYGTGILFGDVELTGLLDNMRVTMYEPIAGLPAEMSSPFDIGISTGAASGTGTAGTGEARRSRQGEPRRRRENAPAVVAEPADADQHGRGSRRCSGSQGQW